MEYEGSLAWILPLWVDDFPFSDLDLGFGDNNSTFLIGFL